MTAMFEDDPFGPIKEDRKRPGSDPRESARAHAGADTDASVLAMHHTLGVKHNQASPGDHNHDAIGSRKIGDGLNLTLTGAKGGNVALTNLIALIGNVIKFTDSTT